MPNSFNPKVVDIKLHDLSSLTKLLIIGVFWLVINFGHAILPSIVFKNQTALSIIITITFLTNLITEILIFLKRKNFQSYSQVLSVQIILNTILLMFFLTIFDRINGPFFLICLLTLMESFLNLNLFLPSIVVSIMVVSTLSEWVYLATSRDILFNFYNFFSLVIRIMSLIFIMNYGKSLAQSILAAKEVDKMKDEFISIASHELRTPMTAIKSYLHLALTGRAGSLKPKQEIYLKRSYESTDRLINLVNDMLNISRIDSGRISFNIDKLDIFSLSVEVVDEFSSRAKELSVKIKIISPKRPVLVIADADKVKEVLYNVIGNSLKYTPKKGQIYIRFTRNQNYLITSIKDNGFGMSKAMFDSLFQKFGLVGNSYQVNHASDSKGTGLGLYICRQIITLHQGQIWAKSAGIGKGTTVSFSLPLFTDSRLKGFQKQFQHTSNIDIIHSKI